MVRCTKRSVPFEMGCSIPFIAPITETTPWKIRHKSVTEYDFILGSEVNAIRYNRTSNRLFSKCAVSAAHARSKFSSVADRLLMSFSDALHARLKIFSTFDRALFWITIDENKSRKTGQSSNFLENCGNCIRGSTVRGVAVFTFATLVSPSAA